MTHMHELLHPILSHKHDGVVSKGQGAAVTRSLLLQEGGSQHAMLEFMPNPFVSQVASSWDATRCQLYEDTTGPYWTHVMAWPFCF
jgi:hypothetical protein